MLKEEDIKKMFKGLHCPKCKSNIEDIAVQVIRSGDDGLIVLQFMCEKCLKGFGIALLGLTDEDITKAQEDTSPPITMDDVLDAHKYIKNLDKNWADFISQKKLKG